MDVKLKKCPPLLTQRFKRLYFGLSFQVTWLREVVAPSSPGCATVYTVGAKLHESIMITHRQTLKNATMKLGIRILKAIGLQ